MKLGIEGKWVGRAVSRSRADGANSFCSRLHGYGGTLMETVLFCPEIETILTYFSNQNCIDIHFTSTS